MDNRLILAILFVTLSWMSVGTYAQTTDSPTATAMTAPPTNMTTAMGNNSTTNATMATDMTTMGNMPNATMTTMGNMPNATMATNMTAMGNMPNATMATNMTTMGNMPNATMAANMTTMGTMTNATMAASMTTMAVTTAIPALMTNITVETLETPFNNSGCGTEQLCAAEPSSCNPADSGSCFFLAAKRLGGQNFEFALAGESEGYIAASLSTDTSLGGNDTTYICANNNSAVQFFGAFLDNGQLNVQELPVNRVKGKVDGNRIQCTFAATVPNSEARTTSFSLSISSGSFNSTSGALGTPTTQLRSPIVNLADPNTNVTNEANANTTSSPTVAGTTAHATTLQQSLTQALLIAAGLLGLAML
ncbi:uncharacterized protein ABDE67_020712 [Symphorus nematophorus]